MAKNALSRTSPLHPVKNPVRLDEDMHMLSHWIKTPCTSRGDQIVVVFRSAWIKDEEMADERATCCCFVELWWR